MVDLVKLDNGLRVINEYMGNVESVSLNVYVKTGSQNETKENNGISHFLEHMAFKGTKTRNTKQIAEEFDNIGGISNAFTSLEITAFYSKVLKENTEKGLELLSDILQNSIFDPIELEKERKVILQELAMGKDDPTDLIDDYFNEMCYKNQPYGRTIIGPAKNIKKFMKNDLIDYVNSQYKTEDIIISFAGNLKTDNAVKLVKKYFNSIKIGKNKEPKLPIYTGGYISKKKKLEQVQLLFGLKSVSIFDPTFYDIIVASVILGDGMSSKLFQEIREKRGLCYTISSVNSSNKNTGVFEIYSAVSPEKINETIIAIIDEIKKSVDTITENDFNRAIVKVKSSILMSKESNSHRAKKNAIDILTKGKIITTEEINQKINDVSIKKVKNSIEKLLENPIPAIAILGNTNNNLLDMNEILKIIKK